MESMPIRIHKNTIEKLKKAKEHPRETYDDVIQRLLKKNCGETDE